MKGHFRMAVASILLVLVLSAESLSNNGTSKCEDGMAYKLTETEVGRWDWVCVKKVRDTCKIVRTFWPDIYFPCTPNAYCDANNVCTCRKGYHETFDGHCFEKLEINSICTFNQQCGKDGISRSQLVCHNGKCDCDPLKSVHAAFQRSDLLQSQQVVSKLCAPLPTKNCFQDLCAPGAKCSGDWWDHSGSGLCMCTPPFMLNPKTLRCTSPYNQSCSSSIPCAEGLVCSDEGRCECMPRQHYSPEETKCYSRVGDICNNTVGCVPDAECFKGICVCKSGYVRDGEDSCVGEFGASCKQDRDCDQSRKDLVFDGGFCSCKPGFQISVSTNRCLVGYNSSCQESYLCHDKMDCKSGFCRCIDGTHYDRIHEECVHSVGKACNSRNDCGTPADCQNRTCRCKDGYVATPSGACAADFGTCCHSDAECSQTSSALICANGTCACEAGHDMSPITNLCSLGHGAPCDGSVPCFDELVCNDLCSCPEGQYFSGKNCLSFAGYSCDATFCISNADCINEICVCKKGYVQTSEGLCLPGFGGHCLWSSDCDQSNNQICNDNGVCDCLPGLKMFNETGQCSLGFRDPCNNSISCGGNLVCKRKKCQCESASQIFTFTSSRCLHRVGGPCIKTSDCIAGTFCDPSYHSSSQNVSHCNCPHGTMETRDRRCINNTKTDCSKDSECDTAAGFECINSECRCSTNAIYSPESRMCLGYVGTQCFPEPLPYYAKKIRLRAVEACIPNAVWGKRKSSTSVHECLCDAPRFIEAVNRTCVHSKDYMEKVKLSPITIQQATESNVADFDITCDNDSDCLAIQRNMICTNKTCVCKPDLEISPATGICSLAHGAPCTDSKYCADGLVCNCLLCSCPVGQYFSSNRCISYAESTCSDYTDCVSNSDCFNSFCVCKDGYVRSPSGECRADFGTSCSSDAECDQTKTNLVCSEEQICDCQQGSTMSPTDGICYVESEVLQNSTCEDHENGTVACLSGRDFAEPCNETTSPCMTRNMLECQNGTCVCNSDSVFDDDQETCIHSDDHGLLGKPCIYEQFCTSGQCIEGICECASDFYSEGLFSCFPKKTFHEPCNADIECGKDNLTNSKLVCLNETCSCNPETSVWATVVQNDCPSENSQPMSLCAPLPNKPCFRGCCSPGAICRMHFFEYGKNGFYSSRQKSNFTMPICDCIPPLQASPKSGVCSSPPGHVCNSTLPCIDAFECINGTCACSHIQHFDPASNTCKTLVPHQCQLSSQCTFFSECVDGVCICQSGYVPTEFGTCAAKVNGSCSVDGDCDQIVNKLECIQGLCSCKTGLKMNRATGICSLPYNAECTEAKPSCGETLICIDGRCTCDPHTGFYDATIDRCLSKVGGSCYTKRECVKWSFCSPFPVDDRKNGSCHCDKGTYETRENFCARGHKASCKTNGDCLSDAGLFCRNFTCECPSQHKYSSEHGICQGLVEARCSPPK